MFASDWIFGLFASVVPLEDMKVFYDNFFEKKWVFFYSIVLSIIESL
jgi:hypothetical protein